MMQGANKLKGGSRKYIEPDVAVPQSLAIPRLHNSKLNKTLQYQISRLHSRRTHISSHHSTSRHPTRTSQLQLLPHSALSQNTSQRPTISNHGLRLQQTRHLLPASHAPAPSKIPPRTAQEPPQRIRRAPGRVCREPTVYCRLWRV